MGIEHALVLFIWIVAVVADIWLTIKIVQMGGREIGVLASKIIGSSPSPKAIGIFGVGTSLPYAVLAVLCWNTPEMVVWGWALLAISFFWRVKVVVQNLAVYKRMK